jgi:glutathione peroxidase
VVLVWECVSAPRQAQEKFFAQSGKLMPPSLRPCETVASNVKLLAPLYRELVFLCAQSAYVFRMKIITALLLTLILAQAESTPAPTFNAIEVKTLDGKPQPLSAFKGKVVLVVNVASRCGFTKQYTGLQQLFTNYQGKDFVIIGFPSNDFGGQEPGTPEEIQTFCSTKYQVTFPLMEKVQTKAGAGQSPVYALLNQKDGGPKWNFHKYLIGKDGSILGAFPSKVEPLSPELKTAIDAALATP